MVQPELCIPTTLTMQEKLPHLWDVFLMPVLPTLFQMRTGVGIPMTSQLKYTLAPVTFQMSLGGVTMEGPRRKARKSSLSFRQYPRT